MMTPDSYKCLLQSFLSAGYSFSFFNKKDYQTSKEIILRHDIDFDVQCALMAAKIESELGIQATYFFMCRTSFYNIFEIENLKAIKEIQSLGHKVSIHFDAVLYNDLKEGLREEKKYFEGLIPDTVDIISFHRPAPAILQDPDQLLSMGIENTYMTKYFKNLTYFSDSTGVWRFGSPIESPEFQQKKSMQLLIHPIWWFSAGETNLDTLKKYYNDRVTGMKKEFEANCKPFKIISKDV